MIGEIQFTRENKLITATLDDSGVWLCPDDPIVEMYLETRFPVRDDMSPSDGEPGYQQLHDAAAFLGGTLSFEDKEDTDALLY